MGRFNSNDDMRSLRSQHDRLRRESGMSGDKFFKAFSVVWVLMALASLAVAGVIVWGFIKFISWLTTQSF